MPASLTDTNPQTPSNRTTHEGDGKRWSAGGIWLAILGIVYGVIGVALVVGGVWLILLGGVLYYLIAGIGLFATGALVFERRVSGVLVYVVTWLFTLAWGFYEVGWAMWPLLPWVVAPTVLLVVLLLSLPAFSVAPGRRGYKSVAAAMAAVALSLAAFGPHFNGFTQARAQAVSSGQQTTPTGNRPADNSTAPKIAPPAPNTPSTMPGNTPQTDASGNTPASAPDSGNPAVIPATGVAVADAPVMDLKAGKDWPAYGGTDEAQRYSPLDQINSGNVGELKQVWLAHTGDMPSAKTKGKYSPENTPIEVGGHLYVCSAMNIMISFDAKTGKEEWRYDPKVSPDAIPYGATCRGVAYFKNPKASADQACATRIIEATLDARLIAVDTKTGKPCADFGHNGAVDLNRNIGRTVPGWYAVTAPPVIVRGVVVTGAQVLDGQAEDAPSGVIRGYDAITGKLAWAWDMAHPGRVGEPPAGDVYGRGTPNMWTAPAADPELGYVYIPLGNSSVDYYGGNRKPYENEYSSSIVAIDVTTGKPVWHFQTVHYDLWDYDLGSQPSLFDFDKDGTTIPAMVVPSKQGQIYILNRKTGKSLFPVTEKPVPTGGVEPENLSKTQPYSGYASETKPDLKASDTWGMSPLDQLMCRIEFHRAYYKGQYTPPTADQPYIDYPGYNGGSDWGSMAVDVKDGVLVANYNDIPNYNQMIPRKEADKEGFRPISKGGNKPAVKGEGNPQAGAPYAIGINAGWRNEVTGMPCVAPPYGWIRAIDLKTGKTIWDQPFGEAKNNGPFGIPSELPVTIGTPNNGGPLVTAGGLIFIAATSDDKFRAFDLKTGRKVWETDLPAGGQATPMTYEADGRQYIVLAPGGHHFMGTKVGDQIIAWALPKKD